MFIAPQIVNSDNPLVISSRLENIKRLVEACGCLIEVKVKGNYYFDLHIPVAQCLIVVLVYTVGGGIASSRNIFKKKYTIPFQKWNNRKEKD